MWCVCVVTIHNFDFTLKQRKQKIDTIRFQWFP